MVNFCSATRTTRLFGRSYSVYTVQERDAEIVRLTALLPAGSAARAAKSDILDGGTSEVPPVLQFLPVESHLLQKDRFRPDETTVRLREHIQKDGVMLELTSVRVCLAAPPAVLARSS